MNMKAKRAFDIAGSIAGIAVAAAPFLGAAFALAVINRGSPFFIQERVGLDRKPFKIFKMKSVKDLYDDNGALLPVEQRTSKFGKWLRKIKLDEVPQFLNVLKGDMSLVGPRPSIDSNQPFGDELSEDKKRHAVKPGITGLAQLQGLNSLSYSEILAHDHKYVDTRSLAGDFIICMKTPFNIISRLSSPHYNLKNLDSRNGVFVNRPVGDISGPSVA